MKVNINQKTENKLLKRTEVIFTVEHENVATPKRMEVRDMLAGLLGKSAEVIVLPSMKTQFGKGISVGVAHVYASKEELASTARKYLQKRFGAKEEKPVAEVKNE